MTIGFTVPVPSSNPYDDWQRGMRDYGSDGRCVKCGATVYQRDMNHHSNWHTEVEKGIQVSNVKWCDPGDHAFKANTPGAVSFTGQQNDDQGIPQTVQMDVCGVHSGRIFASPQEQEKSTMRAVESAYRQDTIDGQFTD